MKKMYFFLLISLFMLSVCSCEDDKKEELVEPSMGISKNSISSDTQTKKDTIQLETNGKWSVTDIPEWISLNVTSGDKSTDIYITLTENRDPNGREAVLKFIRENLIEILTVKQSGLKDVIQPPTLPIFHFNKIELSADNDVYHFETNQLFINPDIQKKIYLGNLVSHNVGTNNAIPVFTGYTFNPIIISVTPTLKDLIGKTYIPSWTEQDDFAKQVIAQKPQQGQSMVTGNGTEFYDYKRLYTLGVSNLGVKLDELISGSSYTKKEMIRKYGLIFSFKQILFSLDMNIPFTVIKEELKEADQAKGVSFVSSVNYGRVGLLIVESDLDPRDVRAAINNAIADKTLSQKETDLIQSADAYYVYFDSNRQAQAKKGKLDAINAYKEAIINEIYNVYPITFYATDYPSQMPNTFSFSVKVSK